MLVLINYFNYFLLNHGVSFLVPTNSCREISNKKCETVATGQVIDGYKAVNMNKNTYGLKKKYEETPIMTK